MSFSFLLTALRRYGYVAALLLIAGLTAGLIVAAAVPKTYESQAQLVIETAAGAEDDSLDGESYVQLRLPTYVEFAKSSTVLNEARQRLDPAVTAGDLSDNVEFSVPSDTVILNVTADWTTPDGAAGIANAVSGAFADLVQPWDTRTGGDQRVAATVLEPAAPGQAAPSSTLIPMVVGSVLGLTAGLLLALWLTWRDPVARGLDEIAEAGNTKILAVMPGVYKTSHALRNHLKTARLAALGTTYAGLFSRLGLGGPRTRSNILTVASTGEGFDAAAVAWGLARTATASGMHCVMVSGNSEVQEYLSDQQSAATLDTKELPVVLPPVAVPHPGRGVVSTVLLGQALGNLKVRADLVLLVGQAIGTDADVRGYLDFSGAVVLTTHEHPTTLSIRSAATLIGESGADLLGVVVTSGNDSGIRVLDHRPAEQVLEGATS